MQETEKPKLPVLAIDLGGTKIIIAIISNSSQVMAKEYQLTLADKGPQLVIKRIFSAIDHLLSLRNMNSSQLASITIAAAGAINFDKGLITSSPNLPGWHDVPLRDIVKEKYRVNTFLINDASAAALGEHRLGAGRGVSNLIYLTVSTGIGGGIIINGKLYSGQCGGAGEIGHMTIDVNGPRCNCGNIGCFEVLASGTAVAKEAIRRIRQGERSSLIEIVAGKIENITAEKVEVAARGGDSLALETISRAATYLGVGMVNLVNIFNPEMIIVGGGMSNMGDLLLNGEDAGVLGAAIFAFEQESD